ncbi:PKD domain-containing protein [Chiayiivirga flava]|uniref:PKD/Chitinase domain-containing protein n=1 Tax=Chiayiivirga flava TaxID=659595 RepID=A0A7W8D6Q1_9GAMM|nr:PKD domain-containing protein [Chiayiivirga flava]MBB5207721.1 hypothetical protein [Chiayiivirga flava]
MRPSSALILSAALAAVFACPGAAFGKGSDAPLHATLRAPTLLALAPVDASKLAVEDAVLDGKFGVPLRFGVVQDASIVDIAKGGIGEWSTLSDGRLRWRLVVESTGARTLDFGFSRFRLPHGAELRIFSRSGKAQLGPFTDADNPVGGRYYTPLLPGADAVLELTLPAEKRDTVELALATVNHGYRDPFQAQATAKSGNCNIDTVCPQGDAWRDEIASVAQYTFQAGSSSYVCTGQLMATGNSAADSATPRFSTAHHCISTQAEAQSIVLYWGYESPTCRTPGTAANSQVLNKPNNSRATQSGTTLLATHEATDWTALQLSSQVPAAALAEWSGWDRSGIAPPGTVGIHHPQGDEKRITFNTDAPSTIPICIPSSTSLPNSHWFISEYEAGTTEGGSSGSGLWSSDEKLLIGVLSGGSASCTVLDGSDCYGRLSTAWEAGSSPSSRMRDHFDRSGANPQQMPGSAACNAPTVTLSSPAFTTAPTAGATVAFTGAASGGSGSGYTYAWDLDGDGVADRSGSVNTVSTVYNARQSVQVRLTVTDSAGCSGVASQALDIKGPALTVTSAAPTQVCGNNDGKIDPGERWQVPVTLRNSGDAQISGPARVLYAASNDYAASTGAACGFDYVDIASGASAVPAVTLSPADGGVAASDDGRSAQAITLGGGGVRLFGTTYSQAVVSTNGYVSFDTAESGGDYDNACNTAPDRGSLGPQLRPMHDDLVVGAITGSGLRYRYFATCPRPAAGAGAGCHVFQWSHMQQYSNSGPATGDFGFQALVYDGGSVVYQYETASPNAGAGATIGLVDSTGAAFDARCNVANAAPANSAICLSSLAGSVRPESPTRALLALPANESSTVNVPFYVPTSAACGAPLAMDFVAAAANNLTRVAPTRVLNANVGAGCTVVNNCPIQQLSFETKQGLYHNRVRPGNGIAHYSYGGGWYTGDAERKPTWYQLSGSVQDYLMRLPLVETHNDGSTSNVEVSLQQRGRAWLAQVSPTEIMYAWQFDDGRSGAELLSHTLSLAGFISRPATNRTETWFALSDPGWGLAVESGSNAGTTLEAIGVFLYDAAGAPRWTLGNGTGASGQAVALTAVRPHCPGCPWLPDYADTAAAAGTITPTWTGATGVSVNTAITFPAPLQGTWNRTALPMIPILPPAQD